MSQYPSIGVETAKELFLALPGEPPETLQAELQGTPPVGTACQVSDYQDLLRQWETLRDSGERTRPAIEGALACQLYDLLGKAPAEALQDVGFWRWLAAVPLRQFVLWHGARKPGEPSSQAFGHAAKTHAHLVESLPYRMYLRGYIASAAALLEPSLDRLQIAQMGGNELWRSHVLRTGTGQYPLGAVAFLTEASAESVDVYREAAKHLNRVGAQVSRWSMNFQESQLFAREAIKVGREIANPKEGAE